MTRDEIHSWLRTAVADQLGIGEEEITLQSRFIEDLGFDSLDIIEMVMTVEDRFRHLGELPDGMLERLSTFGGSLAYIDQTEQGFLRPTKESAPVP